MRSRRFAESSRLWAIAVPAVALAVSGLVTACARRLDQFFTQWFDTAYPPGGGLNKPQITGPGLDGPGFYNASGGCG